MADKKVTIEYNDANGYGGQDGFKLYARTENYKVAQFIITLDRENISTDAMKLLAKHLSLLADRIDAETTREG